MIHSQVPIANPREPRLNGTITVTGRYGAHDVLCAAVSEVTDVDAATATAELYFECSEAITADRILVQMEGNVGGAVLEVCEVYVEGTMTEKPVPSDPAQLRQS